jgi:hypothetical protein
MEESFASRWSRKWAACGFEDIGTEMLACGPDVLPDAAAPFLTFDRASRPAPIWEVFGVRAQWSGAERERLSPYRTIGSDGAGNPICIEQGTGSVVLLDHEDRFRTRQFVNSGVRQLAECLLAFLGEQDPERFRAAVRAIDPAALAEGSFWQHEAAGLGTKAEPGAAPERNEPNR